MLCDSTGSTVSTRKLRRARRQAARDFHTQMITVSRSILPGLQRKSRSIELAPIIIGNLIGKYMTYNNVHPSGDEGRVNFGTYIPLPICPDGELTLPIQYYYCRFRLIYDTPYIHQRISTWKISATSINPSANRNATRRVPTILISVGFTTEYSQYGD